MKKGYVINTVQGSFQPHLINIINYIRRITMEDMLPAYRPSFQKGGLPGILVLWRTRDEDDAIRRIGRGGEEVGP
jgi:hypothetical protein